MTDVESIRLQRSVQIKVPFHDTDAAGLIWHGNYFKYFELARCELLDAIDYNYNQMKESGFIWPIVDLQARFIHSLEFEQQIKVTATLDEWLFRLRISYQIHDEQGQLVCKGRTDQAPIEQASGELQIGSPDALVRRVNLSLANEVRSGD